VRVAVFGLGYVGSVTAACLAKEGHEVVGVDVSSAKVEQVTRGIPTVSEPGLGDIMAEAVRAGLLRATTSVRDAVEGTDLAMICVGTPSNVNGSLDTRYVERVCTEIAGALQDSGRPYVVVVRSTVLPGTARGRLLPLFAGVHDVDLAVNPEFLREGSAVRDFYNPSVIVIGCERNEVGERVAQLYAGIEADVVVAPLEAAELAKYANNAFHALKITFANEIGAIAKAHGVDGRRVMEILTMDTRLNVSSAYLRPGYAFGGSCLPKDLRALLHRSRQVDVSVPMLEGVAASNESHVARAVRLVEETGLRRVAVLGLAFKAGTDDVRESPSVPLIETLIGRGFDVLVHDEAVVPERLFGANRAYVERELPHIASILRPAVRDVVEVTDVIVIANGNPDYRDIAAMLRPEQRLIDLVGVVASNGTLQPEGLCW